MLKSLKSIQHNILLIRSDDPEVLRKGRIVQFLVILLLVVGLAFLFFDVLETFLEDANQPPFHL